ncbi:MAG: dienelactone hydrolase family protein, partial [Bacteroidota bacterium]
YIRETVSYKVEEDESINAFVLSPKTPGIYPGIICHHQHQHDRIFGKEEPAGINGNKELAYAEEITQKGFICLVPDSLAFGERRDIDDPIGYHYYEVASHLVQGKTLLAKNIHDLTQGLDYLESREDVASNKLGFIGHSFGGRMAIWMAAMDHRIKATVCNCGCISYKHSLTRDAGIQLEFLIQGIMKSLDIEDLVKLIEPNHLLISGTTQDKWCRGMEEVYTTAKPAFKKGSLELAMYEGVHIFNREMREYAYDFLMNQL